MYCTVGAEKSFTQNEKANGNAVQRLVGAKAAKYFNSPQLHRTVPFGV